MPRSDFRFRLDSSSGAGPRLGRVDTSHGGFDTPAYLPVASYATVRGVSPSTLEVLDLPGLLCNAFHLALRPGVEVVRGAGGLHRFMGWHRPIVTDSGGFQVFSLRDRLRLDEDGVHFRSPVDGSPWFLGPVEAYAIQRDLGTDVAMVLDHCLPASPSPEEARAASDRTIRWARRTLEVRSDDGPAVFAIVQGSTDLALREQAARTLALEPFDGFAIGGVSVGEEESDLLRVVRHTAPVLPVDRPRYLMGVGEPRQVLAAFEAGVDFVDCVLPTRNARRGDAYTRSGKIRIRAAANRNDPRPLEEGCPCEACRTVSRGYLRHLFLAGEMLGPVLLTLHNLVFVRRLVADAREATRAGTWSAFRAAFEESFGAPRSPPED